MAVKKQEITLELTDKGNGLSADSLATTVESIVAILRSVDSSMWSVAVPRYRWTIKRIKMESPLELTMEGARTSPDAPDVDVVTVVLDGLERLDQGKKPRMFPSDALINAKRLVSVYASDGVLSLELCAPGHSAIRPSSRVAKNAEQFIPKAKTDPFDAYGSVEGVLRRVTVDEREDHEASDLQIIDRFTSQIVECKLTPELAERLAPYIRHRVVVYGMIRYISGETPQRIKVEDFDAIIEQDIPTLEDLHAMHIDITGGEDAADYIAHLRGDDD